MRAVNIVNREVVTLEERPDPVVGEGQIGIRVAYAGINPADTFMWRSVADRPAGTPLTPGMDVSGVVESVGANVSEFSVGQEVMAVVNPRRPEGGAQAELVAVDASWAVTIPAGVSLQRAATLPMTGLTAVAGLALLDLAQGASLGVTGGAGHLASLVIPMAKARGMLVVADAKPDDANRVASSGADIVLPRGEFAEAVREHVHDGVDAVYDTANIRRAAVSAIRDDGAIAVIRGWEGSAPERGITVFPVSVGAAFGNREWLAELATNAAEGRFELNIEDVVAPDRIQSAYERMEAGGIHGRLVIGF